MDFAPRLAVALRKPLIAGCVEYEKQGDRLILTRQIFNAKMNMKTAVRGEPPYLATASPGAFPGDEVEAGGQCRSRRVSGIGQRTPAAARWLIASKRRKGRPISSSAPIIVSGGRGLKEKAEFQV